MRRVVLLAGGALLAGAGLFINTGAGPTATRTAASIQGGELAPAAPAVPAAAPTTPPPADEISAFENLAQKTAKQVSGDVELDLSKIELVDGAYVAPLKDGRKATLTLDPELQALAEKLLDQSRAPRGAIVAMTPDGRVLAFAGRRTDDNKGGKDGKRDFSLVTDVWAPSASVFKIVTASALLTNGYDAAAKVCYHGGVRSVMESNLVDSKQDGRCETLGYGLAHSNNAILGKLAYQNLDPVKLDRHARDLGLASTVPASFGLKATCGELSLPQTKDLSFAKSAAGFMGARLSVLGGAVLSATFAGGGEQPVPQLIAAIDGTPVPGAKKHRVVSKTVADQVGSMMVETCDSGSAARTFRKRKSFKVAGKTGTLAIKEPFFMEHSWFVGYAPAEAPEVVVSVLLGNPESWHIRGHEAAKRMIDQALRGHASSSAEDRDEAPAKKRKGARRRAK